MSGEGEMFRTKPAEASYSMASEPAKQIGSEPLRASYAALIGFSAKELPIGIFDPARQQFSIRTGKGVLQVEQACDQARRPVFETQKAEQRISKTGQSIKSASLTRVMLKIDPIRECL